MSVLRVLACDRPAAFTPNFAEALHNLSIASVSAGRAKDALAAAEEAVALRRVLAADWPEVYAEDLDASLTVMSVAQLRLSVESAGDSDSDGS